MSTTADLKALSARPDPAGETIAETRDVSKAFVYRKASLTRAAEIFNAVDKVSLCLERSETLAIVGESGCGKSTFGRLIAGLLPPSSGEATFRGHSYATLSAEDWRASRRNVQIIFQDAAGSLDPRLPVEIQVREPLDLHEIGSRADRAARTREMLDAVQLGRHLWQAVPSELSGGQQQRVVIARALITKPELVICDEPVSALDVSIQAQILSLLADLKSRMGLTLVFISHDLAVVRQIADRVAVMYLGRVCECGPAGQVLSHPRHPYTKALLSAVPVPDPAVKRTRLLLAGDPPSPHTPPAGCRFHTRCPVAVGICSQHAPERQFINGHEVHCHFPENAP
ncbi:oligopeptide/dipeptide ABC transporter ATP-binding protein [Roseibium sp.]|uniref:ABC transporter ATP-binding protein n=1 Tax=Roseibium sp. TaxID=1936156 RepID=UPI0032656622